MSSANFGWALISWLTDVGLICHWSFCSIAHAVTMNLSSALESSLRTFDSFVSQS